MLERHRFGKHWFHFEPDGTAFLKYHGSLSLMEMEHLSSLMAPMIASCKEKGIDVYMMFDVKEATQIEPDARKFCMEWLTRGDFAGAVNFGGGLLSRTAAEMVISALRLLHKMEIPLGFVKTEAAARAWVAEQRQKRAAARP